MRARLIASVVAVLAALLVGSGVATAADCGTTVDQWVGTHTGTLTGSLDPEPMTVVIEQGLEITTILSARENPVQTPTGTPAINGQLYPIHWSVIPVEPVYHYAGNEVSCSGGVVTSFSGFEYTWIPGWGMFVVASFDLSRGAP